MNICLPARPPLHRLRLAVSLIVGLLALLALAAPPALSQGVGPLYTVAVDGVLSRYAADHVRRALREAEAADAEVLVVRLSNGGAVLSEARALATDLAAARVPVVVYIAPAGTRAGAAGSWLLSAAHIAAMAPDTSFGVAAPLAIPAGAVSDATRELFYTEAERQLADWNRERGRNEAWVPGAVREGAILTNAQATALDPPAVEIVARDEAELLTLLEGRSVVLSDGEQRSLATLGRSAEAVMPTIVEAALLLLASPTVAFLLLVMAGMAIYAELVSPGIGLLAGVGVALLLTSLVGLVALPVSWISLIGLLLAFGLVATDLFTPTHGALTVLGLLLLVVSAMTLFDGTQAPGVGVGLWAVLLVAAVVAAFAGLGLWLALRAHQQPVVTGQEVLVGRLAEVRKRLDPEGMVFVEGALWRAISEDGEVEPGEWVRVTAVYNLRLTVRRLAEPASSEAQAGSEQSPTP